MGRSTSTNSSACSGGRQSGGAHTRCARFFGPFDRQLLPVHPLHPTAIPHIVLLGQTWTSMRSRSSSRNCPPGTRRHARWPPQASRRRLDLHHHALEIALPGRAHRWKLERGEGILRIDRWPPLALQTRLETRLAPSRAHLVATESSRRRRARSRSIGSSLCIGQSPSRKTRRWSTQDPNSLSSCPLSPVSLPSHARPRTPPSSSHPTPPSLPPSADSGAPSVAGALTHARRTR